MTDTAVDAIHIIFDGFPGPDGPRFIEAEDGHGKSINAGEWVERPDGLTALVIPRASPAPDRASDERLEQIAADRADWLVDAVATSTQNRAFLRGEPEEDEVATESIYLNGKKAILVALSEASK